MSLKRITLTGEQKKILFLPPTQPIQIKGVAGSGKTTVALYRAKHLLDTESNLFQEANVVIFTYNKTLVKYISSIKSQIPGGYQENSNEVTNTKPIGLNIYVINFHKWAYDFIKENGISLNDKTISDNKNIISNIKEKYFKENISNKSAEFFSEEFSWMKGKVFNTKEEYIEAKRIGRGTEDRVTKADKEIIWDIFTDYNKYLREKNLYNFDDYALLCLQILAKNPYKPYTHIVIDEAQDLNKAQILVISQLVSDETKSISIIADAAQRIYKSGFTWSEVGLNVKGGRTVELKKNYRSTVPIVRAALSLLEKEKDKSDFTNIETAVKGDEKPLIGYFINQGDEYNYILKELNKLKENNNIKSTVILHRNREGVKCIELFLQNNNFKTENLQDVNFISENDYVKVSTLSSIKGLEFENVFIIDLNDDIIPYPKGFIDENDDYHLSTERRLLYTCMTRAKDKLFLLCSNRNNPCRFLSEINSNYLTEISN
jgi:DNA helicase